MKEEIFTKTGKLRKTAPKRYECKDCGTHTTKTSSIKTEVAVFRVCPSCGGTLIEREVFTEWSKRNSGQWEVEERILEVLGTHGAMSKPELEKHFTDVDKHLFNSTFSSMCYWGELNIDKSARPIVYNVKKKVEQTNG